MNPAALDTLLKSQPGLWRGRDRYTNNASIPTGFAALDNALPAQGWSIGGVTELLIEQHGIGELSLLLPALCQVAGQASSSSSSSSADTSAHASSADHPSSCHPSLHGKGWAALINPPHIPYAPAFSNAGIALERLLIVNTGDDINTLWATEQILRSGLFGAVIAWVQKSSAQRQRRLQLAAESGGCWATVFRPLHANKEHSPVATRICVTLKATPLKAAPRETGPPEPSCLSELQLTLDIIKVRAGNPQIVTIRPEEFDLSQGAEWPVPKPLPGLRSVADVTPITLRSCSDVR